jgi:hypothetical protein
MKEQLLKTPLTDEEKQQLKNLHEEKEMVWSEIESYFPNRDQIQLRNEYRKMKRHEKNHNALYSISKQEEMKQVETNKEEMKQKGTNKEEEQNDFYIEDNIGMFDDWFSLL